MSKTKGATFTTRDTNADPMNLRAAPHEPELKEALRERLLGLSERQLKARLQRQINENHATPLSRGDRDLSMITRVLDTSVGSTGNVLPRVDLEQTIYSLFVKQFPKPWGAWR